MAVILKHHHLFPHEMTSEEQAQEFPTDDLSLHRYGKTSASDWLKQISPLAQSIRSTG